MMYERVKAKMQEVDPIEVNIVFERIGVKVTQFERVSQGNKYRGFGQWLRSYYFIYSKSQNFSFIWINPSTVS